MAAAVSLVGKAHTTASTCLNHRRHLPLTFDHVRPLDIEASHSSLYVSAFAARAGGRAGLFFPVRLVP